MKTKLSVTKIKSKTKTGKWFSCEVNDTIVKGGKIYFILDNEINQIVMADDCLIINFNIER